MDIFTINLDSRPDRWNRVMAIQRAYPWARFQRIPAVQVPIFPTAACTVSHQTAVLMAAADEMPEITVAEDDIEPTRYFSEWPTVVERARERGLDYVVGAVATTEDNRRMAEQVWDIVPAGDSCSLIPAQNGRGTHLITYFASAYQKVLELPFGTPIDGALTMHPELRGGFAFPYVAVQGDGYSDLCGRSYDTPLLYAKASATWAERIGYRNAEPWTDLLAPVMPASDGIEATIRITMRDLIFGRRSRNKTVHPPPFMEGRLDG